MSTAIKLKKLRIYQTELFTAADKIKDNANNSLFIAHSKYAPQPNFIINHQKHPNIINKISNKQFKASHSIKWIH